MRGPRGSPSTHAPARSQAAISASPRIRRKRSVTSLRVDSSSTDRRSGRPGESRWMVSAPARRGCTVRSRRRRSVVRSDRRTRSERAAARAARRCSGTANRRRRSGLDQPLLWRGPRQGVERRDLRGTRDRQGSGPNVSCPTEQMCKVDLPEARAAKSEHPSGSEPGRAGTGPSTLRERSPFCRVLR